ncbi:MAG: SUF system Fe-S cluster assembly regulator [Myxococcota bacterium]
MLRISKLADYGIVLASQMAARGDVLAVSDLSAETGIPQPTASKVLKRLARAGVAVSQRGARGGYRLARGAEEVTLAEILVAIEGPIAVTECSTEEHAGECDFEGTCDVQPSWRFINRAVQQALEGIRLSDLVRTARSPLVPLARSAEEAASLRAHHAATGPTEGVGTALPTPHPNEHPR